MEYRLNRNRSRIEYDIPCRTCIVFPYSLCMRKNLSFLQAITQKFYMVPHQLMILQFATYSTNKISLTKTIQKSVKQNVAKCIQINTVFQNLAFLSIFILNVFTRFQPLRMLNDTVMKQMKSSE